MPGEISYLGAEQAKLVGKRLQKVKFDHIYVSDLKRTVDTANYILSHSDHHLDSTTESGVVNFNKEMRLREKSAGVYEGQPLGSTSHAAKELGLNPREYKPEGGESWLDLNARLHSFLHETVEKHLKSLVKT
eukprot:403337273